jgi:hypothetical protein
MSKIFNRLKAVASDHILRLLLLLEKYGIAFHYLSGKKNVYVVANALFCLNIYSLKIQDNTEKTLTVLSGSDTAASVISNFKNPIQTALIFKEQITSKFKSKGLREKGLAQHCYSIQLIEGYDLLCYKDNIQGLHF